LYPIGLEIQATFFKRSPFLASLGTFTYSKIVTRIGLAFQPGMMMHICHPSYSEGTGKRIMV
jgi:hypothetical protein